MTFGEPGSRAREPAWRTEGGPWYSRRPEGEATSEKKRRELTEGSGVRPFSVRPGLRCSATDLVTYPLQKGEALNSVSRRLLWLPGCERTHAGSAKRNNCVLVAQIRRCQGTVSQKKPGKLQAGANTEVNTRACSAAVRTLSRQATSSGPRTSVVEQAGVYGNEQACKVRVLSIPSTRRENVHWED